MPRFGQGCTLRKLLNSINWIFALRPAIRIFRAASKTAPLNPTTLPAFSTQTADTPAGLIRMVAIYLVIGWAEIVRAFKLGVTTDSAREVSFRLASGTERSASNLCPVAAR